MKIRLKSLLTLAVASVLSAGATSQHPEIYGCVISQDGWTIQENAIGVYRIPTGPDMNFVYESNRHIDSSGGGVLVGDTYWTCYFVDLAGTPMVFVQSYDVNTWEETSFDYGEAPIISTGVTYDPVTRKVYGCFRNDSNTGYVFGTVDYQALKRTRICDLSRMWSAIGCTKNGQIYAIDDLGDLYKVDKSDGNMQLVGSTGLKASHPSSAVIDPISSRMYYALTSYPDGSLYEIDLATASPTLIYHFPENQEVVGLYIPAAAAEAGAPDIVSALSLDFPGGSLKGNIRFTAPDKTFGGSTGTGEITYTIEANGSRIATGSCQWGKPVEAEVTLPRAANYDIKVYVSNAVGNGPTTEVSAFIGKDKPLPPSVTMTQSGNNITLTWSAVTESVNGGYVDIDGMVYDVTRLPDNKIIVSGTQRLSVADVVENEGDLISYSYQVIARYSGMMSEPSLSDKIWTGAANPPYSVVFDEFASSEPFKVTDANNDGNTWEWRAEDKAFRTYFSRSANSDDWLFTPALRLQRGKIYRFDAMLRSYNGNPEYAEIKWGKKADPLSMTGTVLDETVIKTRTGQPFGGYIEPDEDGIYYIGIHCTTPASQSWYLYADGITMGAPASNEVPAAPEELSVIPDFGGKLEAEIKVKAPLKSAAGTSLQSLLRLEVYRDGTLIKTFPSPSPGAELSLTDQPSETGYHVYNAVAYNSDGEGKHRSVKAFIGVNIPGKPAWAKVVETEIDGQVTITWAPVDKAEDGTSLNPDLVRYDIITVDDTHDSEPYNVAENVSGTSHTLQAVAEGQPQRVVYYAIKAVTDGGYSLMTLTDFIPVGKGYQLPYSESYSGGYPSTIMRPENGDALWSIYKDDSGIPSQDGDHGMAAMFGELDGSSATLYSGKVSLAGAVNPSLSLYTFNITGADRDTNELEILLSDGSGFKSALKLTVADLGEADGWYPVIVSLKEYAGKNLQFAIRGTTHSRKFTLIDNIRIFDTNTNDLAAGFVVAPASVKPYEKFKIQATVENHGSEEASGYSVTLVCNNHDIVTMTPPAIKERETLTIDFDQTANAASDESLAYSIRIDFDKDKDNTNNTSDDATVNVEFPTYPSPVNLKGSARNDGTTIIWDEPDLGNAIPERIVDDFESYESWSKETAGDWTFADKDGAPIGSIKDIQFPGIDYNSTLAWFVLDATHQGLSSSFDAYSGNKYLSTMFCLPNGDFTYTANDDWAISPELYGGPQKIAFMARSINQAEAEESFEVLWSRKKSTRELDFRSVESVTGVPGEWTRYEFDLPDGAKYFAIRYNKTYGLMLHIDDVEYIPAEDVELTLEGYNVYRNGTRINDKLLTAKEYNDNLVCNVDTRYAVSAVYKDAGESRASEAILLNVGTESIIETRDVDIRSGRQFISICGGAGLRGKIADTAGRILYDLTLTGNDTVNVAEGIYIVKVEGKPGMKVIVK